VADRAEHRRLLQEERRAELDVRIRTLLAPLEGDPTPAAFVALA
jgi:hypothetical protein